MFDSKKFCVCSALFILEIFGGVFTYPTYGQPDAHLGGGGLGDFSGIHGGYQEAAHPIISNDHHGGVSIIGAGGSAQKGITIDLTKEHGGGHTGLFGGSFLSSGGGHGKSDYLGGDVEHVQTGHSGLGAYSSGLSSYDVGGGVDSHDAHALTTGGHDAGEISPVLYSSFKEHEHSFGQHTAAFHAGGGGFGDFDSGHHAAFTAPAAHYGGGFSGYEHSAGFGIGH